MVNHSLSVLDVVDETVLDVEGDSGLDEVVVDLARKAGSNIARKQGSAGSIGRRKKVAALVG